MLKPFLTLFSILFSTLLSINGFADTTVTLSSLKDVTIFPEVTIPATTMSLNNAKISSEVRATVKKIPVLVGDSVKKGDILVELNSKDYKLNLRRAKVALKGIESRHKLALYQYKQAQSLFKNKAISDEFLRKRQAELTTLKAEKDSQQVSLEIAQRELNKCIVHAPFNAIVTQRIAQVGELANPGTPLINIIDISRIEVSVKLQPQDIASFKNSENFYFETNNKTYKLQLRKLSSTIDPIQRNREARLLFTGNRALPGASGILKWKQTTPHVPANLIVRRKNGLGFFIEKNNTAKFITIKNISEGRPGPTTLSSDHKVIINGRFSVQNGDALTIK